MSLKKIILQERFKKTREDFLIHWTNLFNYSDIIESNRLEAKRLGYGFRSSGHSYFPDFDSEEITSDDYKSISFTRNVQLQWEPFGFVFYRNKLKQNFKLYPVKPTDDRSSTQWQEEVIINQDVYPLSNYVEAIAFEPWLMDDFFYDVSRKLYDGDYNRDHTVTVEDNVQSLMEMLNKLDCEFTVVTKHGILDGVDTEEEIWELIGEYTEYDES